MVKRILYLLLVFGLLATNLNGCMYSRMSGTANTYISENRRASIDAAGTSSDVTGNSSLPKKENSNNPSSFESFWNLIDNKCGRDIFNSFSSLSFVDDKLSSEDDRLSLLIGGLKHSNPFIRWYSAYNVIDFRNSSRAGEIKKLLEGLIADPVKEVSDAALFSLDIIKGSFSSKLLVKNPSKSYIVFCKYHEARYNDGRVWMIDKDKISLIYKSNVSIFSLAWSPDGSWLSVTFGGRIWSDTEFMNMDTKLISAAGLTSYIFENSTEYGYKVGNNPRPDPYVSLMEWSPDSSKALLYYKFNDDSFIEQNGLAVYNVRDEKIQKVMPLELPEGKEISKPENFVW